MNRRDFIQKTVAGLVLGGISLDAALELADQWAPRRLYVPGTQRVVFSRSVKVLDTDLVRGYRKVQREAYASFQQFTPFVKLSSLPPGGYTLAPGEVLFRPPA